MKEEQQFYEARLSPQQRTAWRHFSSEADATCRSYIIARAKAALGNAAVEAAVRSIASENESLRTEIVEKRRQPIQRIHPADASRFKVARVRGELQDEHKNIREDRVKLLLENASDEFTVLVDDLMRGESLILVVFPSLTVDFESRAKVVNEIVLRCVGPINSKSSNDQLQYLDISEWLHELAREPSLEIARKNWSHLCSALPAETISLRCEVTQTTQFKASRRCLQIPPRLVTCLEQAGRQNGVALDQVYHGCWTSVLTLMAGRQRIAHSRAVSVGSDSDVSDVVGLFDRQLPLDIEVLPQRSLREHLDVLSQECARAQANAEAFVSAFESGYVESAIPYYPHHFEWWYVDSDRSEIEILDSGGISERFAIRGVVLANRISTRLIVDFNRFEFTDKEIEAILGAWKGSLQRAAETMDIRSVDLVATQVTERIGNAVLVDRRSQLPRLLDWVEDQMGRLGSGQVKEADRTLELSEINRSANRFSRQLQALGCEIGDRVVIALPRCASFIVSMLAILKAGGTYVPVDIYSPVERLRKVFEDCGARLVVTSQDLRQSLCDIGATVLEFDEHSFRTFGDQRLDLDRPQEAAAYILFTSGSTGSPKGVEISDTSLLNQLRWFISEFDLTGTDRYLHRTATCFDASVWEIWVPLLTGGTIVIHQQQRSLDLEEILRILVDEEITVVQFTPSLLRLAAGLDSFAAATSLRYLFCGGEVLQPELAASVQRTINATLVNLYGPTETCVQVLFHKVDSNVTYRTIPLGKEIDNCVVDIVDPDSRQRLKVGAIGELWIRGLPVFRGYVNRPEETARAIGSLSSNNSRWYRSGDVCRKLVDGSFECLGRRDNQVKLRGFRVELDEVSAQISRITEGRNVATLCIDGAYLVSFVESETVVQGLLDELADRVPDYMIPTSIYFRSSLPRSASGKIDTQALRLLLQTLQRSKSPLTSETEKAVARIWADVLALENIGADDDFFAIGGDSIRSVEIVYSARRSGLVFTVLDLFDYRTPRRLAEAIDHGQINPAVTDAVAPNDSPTIHSSQVDAYPATSMQRYMIERYREDSQRTGVFHAQQVLTITGLRLSLELLQAAIDRLCSAINFRTRFAYHQGKLFQIVVDRHVLTIQEHDLSDLSDHAQREQREHICAADLEHAFDPLAVDEPLVRFILIKYGEAHHELVVSNHHAIQDGWGNHYFLQCLLKDYGRQAAGDDRHMVYDETTNDCKTFVFLEERCANDPASLEFWRSQVCEDNRAKRSERMTGTYWKELERTLDERTRRALAEVRESGGVSYKAIFLSAYSYILTHNASTSDDWIGVVSNGRCEQLNNPTEAMGLFWTMLPFRYPTRSAGTKGPDVALAQDWLEKTERYRAFPVRNIFELSGTSDLFDATFNYIRFPNIQTDSTKLNGRVVASRAFDHFGMPLQLSVSETASVDFTIHLRYAADVWSRGDIEILWSQLMGAIAEVKASEKKRSSLLGTDG